MGKKKAPFQRKTPLINPLSDYFRPLFPFLTFPPFLESSLRLAILHLLFVWYDGTLHVYAMSVPIFFLPINFSVSH